MKKKKLVSLTLAAACLVGTAIAQDSDHHHGRIRHVLLISVDGMHAVDFANCANGISTVNNAHLIARHWPPLARPVSTTSPPAPQNRRIPSPV